MGKIFKTLKQASGIYLSILGIFLSYIVSRIDWLYIKYNQFFTYGPLQKSVELHMIFGFPSWILGLTFGFFWFFILSLLYANKLRVQIEDGYKEIAELRGTGVSLRNRGTTKFANDAEWKDWEKEILNWNEDTKRALKKVSVAIGIWFATLDTVPIKPRVSVDPTHGAHLKLFREHDRRLHNLGRLIRDLWGIGEVHQEDIS